MQKAIKILVFLFFSLNIYSQDWQRINELDYDAEYYFLTMQYEQALDYFLQIYDLIPNNPSLNYKIGVSYLNLDGEKFKAIKYLELAADNISEDFKDLSYKDPYAPKISLLFLGNAYRIANSFDQAIEAFNKFRELLSPEDDYNQKLVNQYIRSCNNAKEMQLLPKSIKTTNLGGQINNNLQNINAVISGDGQTLAYTTISKRGYEIYISKKEGDDWGEPKKITNRLSTHNLFKTSAISFYGDELYLIYNDPFNQDIFVSNLIDFRWEKAVKLKKPINSKSKETHVSLSNDGNTMYFTSDRKGGFGDLDIYKSVKDTKGKWGEPVNMGSNVNTIFNEETPFVTPDEELLFFSSEGHEGMGGFDIFYADLSNPEQEVKNIGYPINTPDNDLFFVPDNGGESGLISRLSNDSYGLKDIYQIFITKNILLKGNLTFENQPVETTNFNIEIINEENDQQLTSIEASQQNNSFTFNLPPGNYDVLFTGSNIISTNKKVSIPSGYSEDEFFLNANIAYVIPKTEELIVLDSLSQSPLMAEEVKEDSNSADSLANNTFVAEGIQAELPIQNEQIVEETAIEAEPEQTDTREIAEPEIAVQKPRNQEVPKIEFSTVSSSEMAVYSIQIMAMENPVEVSYFKNLADVEITKGKDDVYRFSVGGANTLTDAKIQLERIKALGYKDAFIRKNKPINSFTIQLMALKKPVEKSYFKNISDIQIVKGTDNLYRYTTGSFQTINEAQEMLIKIQESGHPQAFIKKVN